MLEWGTISVTDKFEQDFIGSSLPRHAHFVTRGTVPRCVFLPTKLEEASTGQISERREGSLHVLELRRDIQKRNGHIFWSQMSASSHFQG